MSFYPSIKRKTLLDALEFAGEYVDVSSNDTNIILHACKTILSNEGQIWEKKDGTDLFDIPMGSFHGAEICDLIGLHLLHQLDKEVPEGTFGLYRDDGLGVISNVSASDFERLSKRIRRIFSNVGFKITIETGAVTTDFLDVTLDLRNGRYHPYRKPNSNISYIHRSSNHPSHIKKALPKMIGKRLSALSNDKETFNTYKADYVEALEKSGYNGTELTFDESVDRRKNRRTRRRKAIYFNAPFCLSVKTNVGKEFFKLINHHFGKDHPYHCIFNRKTIKLSYSCMGNVGSIIKAHNRKIIQQSSSQEEDTRRCNCRKSRVCPLDGRCLTKNVIYEATVSTPSETRTYIGSTGRSFKERFGEHTHALKHKISPHETELSKHVWKKRSEDESPTIKWSIRHSLRVPEKPQKICATCNLERIEIAAAKRRRAVNKRSELTGQCVHFARFYF